MLVTCDDLQNLTRLVQRNLLCVSGVGHWLILVVFQTNVPQLAVGNVLHKDPAHIEAALPLVLRPYARTSVVVHGRTHLGHAAEVPAAIHAEEQVERPFVGQRTVSSVKTLIAMFCAAPDIVLNGAMDVVLRVALDDEDATVLRVPVKVLGIVVVHHAQFLQNWVGL